MAVGAAVTNERIEKIPPRERILAVAGDLFYRHGIRAVGVEAIADAAGTNKMTLYRHFALQGRIGGGVSARICQADRRRLGPLRAGASRRSVGAASRVARGDGGPRRECRPARLPACQRGGRAAGEGPSGAARDRGIQLAQRARLVQLARSAGLSDPDMLADELYLLLEGARVTAQSVGADGLGARLVRMGEAMIAAHAAK